MINFDEEILKCMIDQNLSSVKTFLQTMFTDIKIEGFTWASKLNSVGKDVPVAYTLEVGRLRQRLYTLQGHFFKYVNFNAV